MDAEGPERAQTLLGVEVAGRSLALLESPLAGAVVEALAEAEAVQLRVALVAEVKVGATVATLAVVAVWHRGATGMAAVAAVVRDTTAAVAG